MLCVLFGAMALFGVPGCGTSCVVAFLPCHEFPVSQPVVSFKIPVDLFLSGNADFGATLKPGVYLQVGKGAA